MKSLIPFTLFLSTACIVFGKNDGPVDATPDSSSVASSSKPNIVFILADDLGWSDTTLYGTTQYYETPHIQALADRGVLLSQAYTASPVCSPTRASIMSGNWPARYGLTQARAGGGAVRLEAKPVEKETSNRTTRELITANRFPTDVYTLAEFLQDNGYSTGHFGKWHLGAEPYSPYEHGFDVDVPHTSGGFGNNFLAPWSNSDLHKLPHKEGDHIEDVMALEAAKFIEKHANGNQPFFLNYWAFSIHSPWYSKESYANYFLEKRDPMNPQSNPIYAGMVKSFDDAIGTIVEALEAAGVMEDTLIVFTSDNGGNTWGPPAEKTGPVFGADIPGTCNFPLRDGKGSLYEGGVRVPTAFIWPNKLPSGSSTDEVFNSVDYFPTIAALIEAEMPEELSIDGMDLSKILFGGKSDRDEQFYYYPHYSGMNPGPVAGVRVGEWKLLRYFHANLDQSHLIELYNLNNDIIEKQNLANRYPDIVERLSMKLDGYLKDTKAALPLPNPAYPSQKLEKVQWR